MEQRGYTDGSQQGRTVRSLEDKIRIQNDLEITVFLRSNGKPCYSGNKLADSSTHTIGWNNCLANSSAENHPEVVEGHKLNNFVLLQKRVAPD